MTATTTRRPGAPAALRAAVAVSLLACVAKIAADSFDVGWLGYAQWLYLPPLAVGLVLAGGARRRRGRWWLAGLVLSWQGDVLGGTDFLLLLGCFLLAHLCYLVALWPTRRRSALRGPAALPYLLLGVAGAAVVAPAAGPVLAGPVVVYAAALTLMAVLATAGGRRGALGGLLFMVSDLTLGLGRFVVDLPTAVQTAVVIGTYVPAQVLLLLAVLTLLEEPPGE